MYYKKMTGSEPWISNIFKPSDDVLSFNPWWKYYYLLHLDNAVEDESGFIISFKESSFSLSESDGITDGVLKRNAVTNIVGKCFLLGFQAYIDTDNERSNSDYYCSSNFYENQWFQQSNPNINIEDLYTGGFCPHCNVGLNDFIRNKEKTVGIMLALSNNLLYQIGLNRLVGFYGHKISTSVSTSVSSSGIKSGQFIL